MPAAAGLPALPAVLSRQSPGAPALPGTGQRRAAEPAAGARERRRTLPRAVRSVRSRWRRSLQTRVVATTLLVSAMVVALLASLLLDQVGRGLVQAKTRASLTEAQSGLTQLQSVVDQSDSTARGAVEALLLEQAGVLDDRGATGDLYDVVLVPQSGTSNAFGSRGVALGDVPPDLRQRLDRVPGPAYEYAKVPLAGGGRSDGLVVGGVIRTPLGDYDLFQLFPLTAEEQTLGLVRRTAAAAGGLLVLLLALIAFLVTQQVVAPVRMAAATAERLAGGRLEERMRVRGEDELAGLASTFNSMAEALQRQIGQLEELSHVQRRFVSDVSHELRTPLTTVRMAADVLFEGREDFLPATARSAELLQAELDRFEELLADLLEISRYDAGAAHLDAEPTDLVRLTQRVLAQARPLAERRGCELRLLVSPGPDLLAEVDHVRIERVLRNLVVNAVEHGEGRPVRIEIAGAADAIAVVVRDSGVGLRAEEVDLVFTRFWRGDPSRARTTGGTGLGLAIAREDVRLHGGELDAWGSPGCGASFRMVLPARTGARPGLSPLPLQVQA